MKKIIIAAISLNNVIGKDNKIPWNIKEELKYFKDITLNHAVLMGRKTFDSIGGVLSDRINIVLSKKNNYEKLENLFYFTSLNDALNYVEDLKIDKLFIIGGSNIYTQLINDVDELLISRIPLNIEGDKFFPIINNEIWKLKEKIHYTSFIVEKHVK